MTTKQQHKQQVEKERAAHHSALAALYKQLTGEDCDAWLEADLPTALALQRPAPPGRLRIVATGKREGTGAGMSVFG